MVPRDKEMFGDLTAAFGFTVLCLIPIMLVSLVVTPILLRFTRPLVASKTKGEPPRRQARNMVQTGIDYVRFYFVSMIILVAITIIFWWGFILLTGTDSAVDFAAQNLPIEREVIEEFVEPELMITPES